MDIPSLLQQIPPGVDVFDFLAQAVDDQVRSHLPFRQYQLMIDTMSLPRSILLWAKLLLFRYTCEPDSRLPARDIHVTEILH